ncbi:EF-hand domain-containing protein [Pseudooceanicola sp. C21-150M6]|uniref:EF-hand domain-containing protein n=1 Tax=Pseudooceanicola sp. C21-150M6 TaxID=3434355 RepID=UPI003D7FA90A
MKRANAITSALILALTSTALPLAAQDRDAAPRPQRGPGFDMSRMDTDGDGKVTREEMQAQAQKRFSDADANGDGEVTIDEIVAGMETQRTERMQKMAERMLKRADANEDGKLTADEMGPRNGDRMFAFLDADEDGAVTREEFERARKMFGDREARMNRGDHDHGKRWKSDRADKPRHD